MTTQDPELIKLPRKSSKELSREIVFTEDRLLKRENQEQHIGLGSSVLEFDDNTCLRALVGPDNFFLEHIQRQLSVTLALKGNRIKVFGPQKAQHIACQVLSDLYLLASKEIDLSDVDRLLTFALEETDFKQFKIIKTQKKTIHPQSEVQDSYVRSICDSDLTFGVGAAGTGKTYLAMAVGVSYLLDGRVDRLILSKPAVEAGERLGFLPGDMKEKIDPYLRPLYDALYDMLPKEQVESRIQQGKIEIAPLAFMRGRTLSNSFIILDEAQNATSTQMKMFLTRLGYYSKMVVTGDLTQIDLPHGVVSGLQEAIDVLSDVPDISFSYFTESEVVRHNLVSKIIAAYNRQR